MERRNGLHGRRGIARDFDGIDLGAHQLFSDTHDLIGFISSQDDGHLRKDRLFHVDVTHGRLPFGPTDSGKLNADINSYLFYFQISRVPRFLHIFSQYSTSLDWFVFD